MLSVIAISLLLISVIVKTFILHFLWQLTLFKKWFNNILFVLFVLKAFANCIPDMKPLTCRNTGRHGISTLMLWFNNILFVFFFSKTFANLLYFWCEITNVMKHVMRSTIYVNAKLISWVIGQGVCNTLRRPHVGWSYSENGQLLFQRVIVLIALQYSTGFTNAVVGEVLQMSIALLPILILHYEWHTVAFQQAKYTGVTNTKLTVNSYLRIRPQFLRRNSTKHNTCNTTAAMTLHQCCQDVVHGP
jgi:hypothetical protein